MKRDKHMVRTLMISSVAVSSSLSALSISIITCARCVRDGDGYEAAAPTSDFPDACDACSSVRSLFTVFESIKLEV